MAKKTTTAKAEAKVEKPKAEKPEKGFKVLDSNGKVVRVVKTEEEAQNLAKVYGGRFVA